MPAVANEERLNAGRPFVQRVRLRELLVDHQPTIRGGDAQRVRRRAAARVDLVPELHSATLRIHRMKVSVLWRAPVRPVPHGTVAPGRFTCRRR